MNRRHHFSLFALLDRLLHSLSGPQTHCIVKAGLELLILLPHLPSARTTGKSQVREVLGINARYWHTVPAFYQYNHTSQPWILFV